ncbi:MAG: hypothetical protein L0338_38090 [Acidobacteria bacterium]|nr:hypothetical protein [Acidobacteriota bacterium]
MGSLGQTPWWIELETNSRSKVSRFDGDLIGFGQRIAILLGSAKVTKSVYALATLDDFLGATYALILAFHNDPPFQYPRGKADAQVVLDRARSIAKAHNVRMNGKWMAGFHFNSALFRLSAVYHRSLKVVTGKPTSRAHVGSDRDSNSLLSQAKRIYTTWTNRSWDNDNIARVHEEVNDLKHTAAGKFWGRNVSQRVAIRAVEELLGLLETWNLQP